MSNHRDKRNNALPEDFLSQLRGLEQSYLTQTDPVRQSGFLGGEERWYHERSIILQAVDADGDFLDVGCANGYLLECLVNWASKKGVTLTPFGVDLGAQLIELAKARLPQFASNFWVANAWEWSPPRKFQFVYTIHDCVPHPLLGEYAARLLQRCVESGGTLIIGAYGRYSANDPARDIAAELSDLGFTIAGSASYGPLPATRIAWIKKDL